MSGGIIDLPFSHRDYVDVLSQIKQQLPAVSDGLWTDLVNSDIGYLIIKCDAVLYDFNSFFCDQSVAETFLSTCSLRESAIRRAKELNYIPQQMQPAQVTIKITNPDFGEEIVIPQNSVWSINGLTFLCTSAINIPIGQTTTTVDLVQGTLFSLNLSGANAAWFKVPVQSNVANINVAVNTVPWTQVDSFIGVDSFNSYKVYEDVGNVLQIEFGANITTYQPLNTDSIAITGVTTLGSAGNIEIQPDAPLPATLLSVVRNGALSNITSSFTGVTTTSALGGQDLESTDSIRRNAPQYYSTQGRLVTAADFKAEVLTISGVTDCLVIGGQTINRYGEVHIIVYGLSPYVVSPDFLTLVYNTVAAKAVVTVTPKVYGPTVIENNMVLNCGIIASDINSIVSIRNQINTTVSSFFTNLHIGSSVYQSALMAALMAIPGVVYVDMTFTMSSAADSHAGAIVIPLNANPDLTQCTLTDASGNVLFTGDGSIYNVGGSFTFNHTQADQLCTLSYRAASSDLLVLFNQVVVLNSLNTNVVTVV